MATKKRFSDGGETTDYLPGRAPFKSDDIAEMYNRENPEDKLGAFAKDMADASPMPAKAAGKQSFAQAFKAAKEGEVFEWNGQRIRKITAGTPPKAIPKEGGAGRGMQGGATAAQSAAGNAGAGRGGRGGPTADELDAYAAQRAPQRKATAADIPGSGPGPAGGERIDSSELERNLQALQNTVGPMSGLLGLARMPGRAAQAGSASRALAEDITPVQFLGKSGAQAMPQAAQRIGTQGAARLGMEAAPGAAGRAAPQGLPMSPRQLEMAKRAVAEQAAREGGDKLNPLHWMAGPKGPLGTGDPTNPLQWMMGPKGPLGYKKGGSVKKYAKGGSVSGASKRADGIASKGKTRGKMV